MVLEHMKKKSGGKSHIVIELIILLVVIVAVALFAVPQLTKLLDSSRQKSADNDAQLVAVAAEAWLTEQETKEIVPVLDADNRLGDEEVSQVIEIAGSIDEETAKTVEITLKGSAAPDCYKLESVELTKKKFKAIAE